MQQVNALRDSPTTRSPNFIRPFSVIFADDCPIINRTLPKKCKEVFEKLQCPFFIETARTGREAWDKCKRSPYQFYIIDGYMPSKKGEKELQGFDVCKKILKRNPEAHVVLFSAEHPETIENACLPKEVEVIAKSIDKLMSSLDQKVSEYIANSRASRKNSADTCAN
jgi:CheY-like chemotaxis protein